MNKNWWYRNCANVITISRFPLCFYLLWMVVCHRQNIMQIIGLFVVICITDYMDGFLARKLKIASRFGGATDRLADKLSWVVMFVFFVLEERIHVSVKFLVSAITVVEAMLLGIWILGIVRKFDVATIKSAKPNGRGPGQMKMGLMCAGILFGLFSLLAQESVGLKGPTLYVNSVLAVLFGVSLVFAVQSFSAHQKKYRVQLARIQEGK